MDRLSWRDFGARGDGTFDCTSAINACFAAAIDTGKEAHGPEGNYKITGTLVWNNAFPRISGEGRKTIIEAHDVNYDWLKCGVFGTIDEQVGPAGWIRDLSLRRGGATPPRAPAGLKAGLVLDRATFTELRNVWVDFAPIGFDLINNNYGTSFYNCRTFDGRCRIGIRLSGDRGGAFASGSDIPFFNCWFGGRDAAVWLERSGGGYNFFGGQLASGDGLAAPNDALGTVMVNKNLEDAGVGGRMSARFFGTSFENVQKAWNVRVHDLAQDPNGCQLLFSGVSFTGAPATSDAIGVLKLTDGYNDSIEWHNCALNGTYTNPVPLSINVHPTTGRAHFVETGTQSFATFAGSNLNINSKNMLIVSQVGRSFGTTSFHIHMPTGLMLTYFDVGNGNGLSFQKSTDWGNTWTLV